MNPGTLTFFTGKMGAGKTTRSKQLAAAQNAVLLSEDEWLAALYPGQISSLDDYLSVLRTAQIANQTTGAVDPE